MNAAGLLGTGDGDGVVDSCPGSVFKAAFVVVVCAASRLSGLKE
jgi:hypothetical protein